LLTKLFLEARNARKIVINIVTKLGNWWGVLVI